MAKRVKIADVAKRADVHPATVSRALNAATQHQVKRETLKRVARAAQELGYVPNAMARGLRTSLSMTIGVIIPDLMNPIFPPIVRGIESFLQPRGYTALIVNTDGDAGVEASVFESLLQRRVDGFILATGRLDEQSLLTKAHDQNVMAVMVVRDAGPVPYPVVTGDNANGIALAVHHLRDLGHRRILHVAGPLNFSTSQARAAAFDSVTAGLDGMVRSTIQADALTVDAGQRAFDELLASGAPLPTAVVASNDLVALGVIRSLHSHGLECPTDVSVVGFNDMPFAADFSPALTTVHMPLRAIGTEAAQVLLAGIEAGEQRAVTLTLPVSLVVRGSTGPAR